jgi:multicomponent Na+:H+ antiporter subunit E
MTSLTMKNTLLLFAILFLLWLLLANSLSAQELVFGGAVALAVALLFKKSAGLLGCIRLTPRALYHGMLLAFIFIRALIKANIDVAFRVVDQRLPIHPGIVTVKTTLVSPLGRMLLANAITLTPGTLTVETNGDLFFIHWIDVTAPGITEATQAIVTDFERHLEVFCG